MHGAEANAEVEGDVFRWAQGDDVCGTERGATGQAGGSLHFLQRAVGKQVPTRPQRHKIVFAVGVEVSDGADEHAGFGSGSTSKRQGIGRFVAFAEIRVCRSFQLHHVLHTGTTAWGEAGARGGMAEWERHRDAETQRRRDERQSRHRDIEAKRETEIVRQNKQTQRTVQRRR